MQIDWDRARVPRLPTSEEPGLSNPGQSNGLEFAKSFSLCPQLHSLTARSLSHCLGRKQVPELELYHNCNPDQPITPAMVTVEFRGSDWLCSLLALSDILCHLPHTSLSLGIPLDEGDWTPGLREANKKGHPTATAPTCLLSAGMRRQDRTGACWVQARG